MSDEDSAFWAAAQQGAANLGLEIRVAQDGGLALHHLKLPGEAGRPTDAEVDTFKAFLKRKREAILRANGVNAAAAPGVAQDCRRLLDWLNSHADSPEALLKDPDGGWAMFRHERTRLVNSFAEDGRWLLEAFRFQKMVRNSVSWADAQAVVPEICK